MTALTAEEIVMELGHLMLKCARMSAEKWQGDANKWDYAGYVYQIGSGDIFLFYKKELHEYDFFENRRKIKTLFREFRVVTQVEGDEPWNRCKAVIRNDGDFRMLFEFGKEDKWTITPQNLEKQYEILIGDIYPEALEDIENNDITTPQPKQDLNKSWLSKMMSKLKGK